MEPDGGAAWPLSRRRVLQGAMAASGLVALGGLPGCSTTSNHGAGSGSAVAPSRLTTSGLDAPIGLGPGDVYLAWQSPDRTRGAAQQAYRVVVEQLAHQGQAMNPTTAWDSGQVRSASQAFVACPHSRLEPGAGYRWRVMTWNEAAHPSPWSAFASFETGANGPIHNAASIAGPAAQLLQPDQYAYARREVTLDRSPIVWARASVSAGQQYELYVNGTRLAKGQAYDYADSRYYETTDIGPWLRAGEVNAFGLLTNWEGPTKGHPANLPDVVAWFELLQHDGRRITVATDGSWRVRRGAWKPGTQRDLEGDLVDFTETIDGPDIPIGWDEPGFDDSGWQAPQVLVAVGRPIAVFPVRTRIVEEPVEALSVTRLASGALVADFGKVYAAAPTVRFRHGTAGRSISMRAGYLLDTEATGIPAGGEAGQVSKVHGTQHTDMSYGYVQRGGDETFHPFDYLGFRYFQVDDPGESLTTADVVALARHAAVPDEHAATFSSSEPTLDAVFELGRHSALYCAQEQFIDTPTREKGSWLWDGFNSSQTAMAAFGDANMTRKSLLEFAQSQARYWPNGSINKIYPTGLGALDIDEFVMIYAEWVWQYWLNTGDEDLIEKVQPVLVKLAGFASAAIDAHTGLVTNLPVTNTASSWAVPTRLNLLAANVFRRVGRLGAALGSSDAGWDDKAASLMAAVESRLARSDGVFVDGLAGDGSPATTAAQDTNACVAVYGGLDQHRVADLAAYVAGLAGMQAPPRTACEVLATLATAGRDRDVLRLLTDRDHDGWARILARGGTFTWEVWEPSDIVGDSMSHGWGSNVLVEIQRWLLGVRPTAPGKRRFDVAPPPTVLDHAAGTVPSVFGPISLGWRRDGSARLSLDLEVPANTQARVLLPASTLAAVTESGQPARTAPGIRSATLSSGTVELEVAAGSYRFAVS